MSPSVRDANDSSTLSSISDHASSERLYTFDYRLVMFSMSSRSLPSFYRGCFFGLGVRGVDEKLHWDRSCSSISEPLDAVDDLSRLSCSGSDSFSSFPDDMSVSKSYSSLRMYIFKLNSLRMRMGAFLSAVRGYLRVKTKDLHEDGQASSPDQRTELQTEN